MNALATLLRYEIWIFLIVLAAAVAYKLLTGKISMRGLLRDKMGGRAISPGRIQMLIATAAVASYYLLLVLVNDKPGEFPEIPHSLLGLIAGSHALYLGGKLTALVGQALSRSTKRDNEST